MTTLWSGWQGRWTGQIDSGRLCGGLGSDEAADVDEVVSDDPESDPALHALVATITATLEPVPTLADADAFLASGTPSLPVAEPTLRLLMPAAGTLGAVVGNADALDTFGFCRSLVLTRIEASISRDQARDASQLCRMYLDRRDQQIRVMWPMRILRNAARAISSTRHFTLRLPSRSFVPTVPANAVIRTS